MAEALGHTWGQIIGNIVESCFRGTFQEVADRHNLYLDYKKPRKARRNRKLVCWEDAGGNKHNLDYVLERGGTEDTIGVPAAFIETAWRRYTRHSKTKAQEVDAAVTAIAQKHRHNHPFIGVAFAGEFTKPSLQQLKSRDFKVLYLDLAVIYGAFAAVGIDASWEDNTPDADISDKIDRFHRLKSEDIAKIGDTLRHHPNVVEFIASLDAVLSRSVSKVVVTILHGLSQSYTTVDDAINSVSNYPSEAGSPEPAIRYDIDVTYSNGDIINDSFRDKDLALQFLETFA